MISIKGKTWMVPRELIEALANVHVGIDTETGHYVCHYLDLGVSLINLEGDPIPAFNIGDCILIVVDEAAINKLLESMTRVEGAIEMGDAIIAGDVKAPPDIARVFSLVWEYRVSVKLYKARIDERETLVALAEMKDSWRALIIPGGCSEEGSREENGSLHL